MIVAVAAVPMMEVALHEIVDVPRVRYGLVPARRPVLMRRLVGCARMVRRACSGIRLTRGDLALVDVPIVGAMQMAFVQIVDMAAVPDGSVPASGSVCMLVPVVSRVVRHRSVLPFAILRSQDAVAPVGAPGTWPETDPVA